MKYYNFDIYLLKKENFILMSNTICLILFFDVFFNYLFDGAPPFLIHKLKDFF